MKYTLSLLCVLLAALSVNAQKYDTTYTDMSNGIRYFKAVNPKANNMLMADGYYKNKIKEGIWRTYYGNGNVHTIVQYLNGVMDGITYEFAPNGALMVEGNYRNAIKVDNWRTYEDGQIASIEHYVNGQLDGPRSAYYESGSIQEEGSYKMGKRQGVTKWYSRNGKLSIQFTYVNGVNSGAGATYYEDGNKQSEGTYANDAETGHWKEYYDNDAGTIKDEGDYTNGNKTGIWKEYDETGKWVKNATYDDKGTLLKEEPVKN